MYVCCVRDVTYIHTYIHTHIPHNTLRGHTHISNSEYIHICIHIYIHTYTHTTQHSQGAHSHLKFRILTYMHTHMHTYIHTYHLILSGGALTSQIPTGQTGRVNYIYTYIHTYHTILTGGALVSQIPTEETGRVNYMVFAPGPVAGHDHVLATVSVMDGKTKLWLPKA